MFTEFETLAQKCSSQESSNLVVERELGEFAKKIDLEPMPILAKREIREKLLSLRKQFAKLLRRASEEKLKESLEAMRHFADRYSDKKCIVMEISAGIDPKASMQLLNSFSKENPKTAIMLFSKENVNAEGKVSCIAHVPKYLASTFVLPL